MDKVRSLGELKANGVSLTDLQNSTVLPRGQDLDQCPVQRGGSEKAVSEISHARGGASRHIHPALCCNAGR